MKLSIIIPLYNEEEQIATTLEEIYALPLPDFVLSKEVIVIDDGSTDNSLKIATTFAGNYDNVTVHSHSKNMGKGAAIRTGLKHVNGDVIVLQDADMELLPQDIIALLNAMQSLNLSFVNGSRYLAGVNRPVFRFWRYMANQFFTLFTSIVVNVKFTDIACGYKLFRKEFIEGIELKENRFGFETELMIKAIRHANLRDIAEVPVHYSPRNVSEGKKIRNIDGFKILYTIIKYGIFKAK